MPYVVPDRFMPGIASGALRIKGALVKNGTSGEIVGHMRMVGDAFTKTGNAFSLGPQAALTQLASSLASNAQLAHLQSTVNSIKLISTIGAVASVAGVGISIAGFAMVMSQLRSMDAKLDAILGRFRAVQQAIDGVDRKLDLLTIARLRHAAELVDVGIACRDLEQRREYLFNAADEFGQLRAFHALLLKESPLRQSEIPIPAAVEAYGRFVGASIGQLKASMLLGDLGAYRVVAEAVAVDAEALMTVDAKDAFRARSLGEIAKSGAEVRSACEDLAEARDRLTSCAEIGRYMADHQISIHDYLAGLEGFREANLIFLPNNAWRNAA
jgi:hypothetical protein